MANRRPKPEEIVTKFRQVEVLTGQGIPRLDVIRQICVTEQTFFRKYRRSFIPVLFFSRPGCHSGTNTRKACLFSSPET